RRSGGRGGAAPRRPAPGGQLRAGPGGDDRLSGVRSIGYHAGMKIASFAAALTALFLSSAALRAEVPTGPEFLHKGDVVPAFKATGIDGKAWDFSFPKGKSTVLLFFLSSCPTCHRMLPAWNRAFERRPPGLNVVGVLLDQEPPGFFQTTPVAFPVVRNPGKA